MNVPPRTIHMHMHFYSLMSTCISYEKKVLDPNSCTCTVSTHTCNSHELIHNRIQLVVLLSSVYNYIFDTGVILIRFVCLFKE